MIKLSDYLLHNLSECGVSHIFMLPGGGAMHLNDSLGKSGIPYTCNLHEQASAIAAEAWAKQTGRMGAVMVTSGPGGTNTVTGVAAAWLDSTPCFFMSGQVKKPDLKGESGLRQLGVQEIDIVSIVAPITKYAVTVTEASTIRYHLEKAIFLANNGRPGPVWLDIPMDVQAAMIEPESLSSFKPEEEGANGVLLRGAELKAKVSQFIALLNEAQRPVLLAGNGVRLANALPELERVIRRLDIPVLTTWLSGDFLPQSHPLFVGRPGGMAPRGANFALQNSDLLLSVGSRLDMVITGYAHDRFAREAKKIVVDVDAAEIDKLQQMNIDVPICADAREFLQALLECKAEIKVSNRVDWKNRCASWKERYPIVQKEYRELGQGVSTYYLAEVLSQEIPESAAVVSGTSGTGIEIFLHTYTPRPGQRVIFSPGLGAMGFGLPAAIGACIGKDNALTICVNGDGGFQMNIQELQTVARLQLPIKFFVLNNDGYASIRNSQVAYFGDDHLVAADKTSGMTLPNITKLATAYGLPTARISSQKNLAEKVRVILEAPGPCVCEVSTPRNEPRAPRLSSFQREDGSMVSKPLEDLWPFLERDEFLSNMIVAPVEE
jgi:acetolactate synthase-1/2/3 large subunit